MDDIMSTEPNITGYINRAVLRIYLEKPGYLDDFREALRLDPKESQRCISAVANSSIDHKTHLDEMAQVMELCIDSGAASVDIYSQLAHTYLVLGRRSEARRVLETAVRSLSSEKDVVVMESTLSCLEGDLGSASDLLKSLVVVVDDQKYRNMLQTVSMEWLKNPESPKAQQPKLVNRPAVTKTTKPIKNDKEKTKRNDPCPCGSGKKFKKCCGNC
ncbi:MAG: SEC-C domain-containing protein [Candidatus Aenigmarchaeota archaeon]|nr:SEC-C domain-containing protein [Candidatus Aenigmarchaeota archaeon]